MWWSEKSTEGSPAQLLPASSICGGLNPNKSIILYSYDACSLSTKLAKAANMSVFI